jgi:ATP-binding cassette, subfamily C, bacterial RsaD
VAKSNQAPTPLNHALNAVKPAVVIAVIFSLFINILALVSPLYMLQVYDRVLASRNTNTLILLTLIAVFLLGVYAALESCRTRILVRGGVRFDRAMQKPLFSSVLTASIKGSNTSDGQAFRDGDSVREFLTGPGLIAFCDAPWIPVFVATSFVLHPWFGILAIAGGIILFGLAIANELVTRASLKQGAVASIAAQSDAAATMRNSEVMRAMGMWHGLRDRWLIKREEMIRSQAMASDRAGGMMSSIRFFRALLQIAVLGSGAYLAIIGSISAGAMIAASILVGRALAPIEGAVGQWKTFASARGAWSRLQALFLATQEESQRMELPIPKGSISVEAVVIAPPGAKKPTIRGLSFAVESGTMLGVIGPSAAGKSTLARSLVGVWPSIAGTIRLDGFDIKQWQPEQLGQYIGYLPQDVELFAGSIAENIGRFRRIDPEKVVIAARLAGVHEMIQQLPDGYDTQIGEGGVALSGGQRQRIALARAIYGDPVLLILDEPNASLDSQGEAALIQTLRRLKDHKRTVIFITHKPNLLAMADKILVLNQGAAQAFGDRDEIMGRIHGGLKPVTAVQQAAG